MIISHLRDFNSRHQITGFAKRGAKRPSFNEDLKEKRRERERETDSLFFTQVWTLKVGKRW